MVILDQYFDGLEWERKSKVVISRWIFYERERERREWGKGQLVTVRHRERELTLLYSFNAEWKQAPLCVR